MLDAVSEQKLPTVHKNMQCCLQYGIIGLLILGEGEYQIIFVTGLYGGYKKKERMRKCEETRSQSASKGCEKKDLTLNSIQFTH